MLVSSVGHHVRDLSACGVSAPIGGASERPRGVVECAAERATKDNASNLSGSNSNHKGLATFPTVKGEVGRIPLDRDEMGVGIGRDDHRPCALDGLGDDRQQYVATIDDPNPTTSGVHSVPSHGLHRWCGLFRGNSTPFCLCSSHVQSHPGCSP
jgi:hypothetical protein